MPPYCPISSTVPHTFTNPTHLTYPPPTTTAGQTQHSHLRRMNNTLAINTRANMSLNHEPKTRSPPPPSVPAQQAAQAIHSSPPALSPPPSPTAPPRPRTPTANRNRTRSYQTVGRAVVAHEIHSLSLTCTPGCLLERFLTSHLEIEARAWPLVATVWLLLPPRANTLDV